MNAQQIKEAQAAALNCAKAGFPYEVAVLLVADWMKRRGIRVTTKHLDNAFTDQFH